MNAESEEAYSASMWRKLKGWLKSPAFTSEVSWFELLMFFVFIAALDRL